MSPCSELLSSPPLSPPDADDPSYCAKEALVDDPTLPTLPDRCRDEERARDRERDRNDVKTSTPFERIRLPWCFLCSVCEFSASANPLMEDTGAGRPRDDARAIRRP